MNAFDLGITLMQLAIVPLGTFVLLAFVCAHLLVPHVHRPRPFRSAERAGIAFAFASELAGSIRPFQPAVLDSGPSRAPPPLHASLDRPDPHVPRRG